MTSRILVVLAMVGLFFGSALALPLKPIDTTADVILVRGGHGHGHARGHHGRHLGWYVGRHRGWAHSRYRMH